MQYNVSGTTRLIVARETYTTDNKSLKQLKL